MAFTFYQLIFIILAYSFIGWVAETVAADLVYHRFVNRGFLNGPVCLIYGISAALMGIVFWELKDYTLYLFIGLYSGSLVKHLKSSGSTDGGTIQDTDSILTDMYV